MLIWIATKGEDTFRTNSSDLYSADYEGVGVITLIKTEHALWDDNVIRPARDLRRGFNDLIRTWKIGQEDMEALSELGEEIYPGHQEGNVGEEFQIFLMGYYYKALGSVVDTSRLVYQKVFGSWGWGDPHFFRHILQLTQTRLKTEIYEALSLVNNDTVGFVGKISALTTGLFGGADTPEKLSNLILLDVDTSAIPKIGQGIIKIARSHNVRRRVMENNIDSLDLGGLTSCNPDYTSNTEPAWGYDVNLVLLLYHYKGRLVFKVDPLETEVAIIR
ncbi:MAG: hypothetical protein FRX48_04007 [Lasallia pustulata]|uniref:Uncharacterized protein n=1 Tax=Lasallia pustulata TaxID=136370 RepID=A0A5M8PQX7_9LECA|nr:MAG: hypothetical protein FRX48_04007 [Lasallia pustulata]